MSCLVSLAPLTTAAGLLQPIPVPAKVWDEITMDFIEGPPKSEGYDTILVVVNRLSKYAHFLGLKHPFIAIRVASIFAKEVIQLNGLPQSIISNKDKIFMSLFGVNISNCKVLLSSTAHLITLDPMDKQRW